MVFWQMVDALGWITGAVMIGGTAWATWYLVTDTRGRRRAKVRSHPAGPIAARPEIVKPNRSSAPAATS